ncbi:hypothetical protein [Amorphus sp. MBR-141]
MKTRMMLAALVACGLAQGAAAADFDGEWDALSNTATSITGNIEIAAKTIQFQNGTKLGIAPAGSAEGNWGGQSASVEGEIFKLAPPADPELLNGNKFCGMPGNPATFVVLTPLDGGLSLIVYTGDATPTPNSDPCAIYNYAR